MRPAAGATLTLRKPTGSSGVGEGLGLEPSAGGAFSGDVIVQPLLVRAYLEGWAAAAQCVRQHLLAAGVIGGISGGGAFSGSSGDEAPAGDAGPPAQLRVSVAAVEVELIANLAGAPGWPEMIHTAA